MGAPKPCFHTDLPLDIGIPGLALRQGKDGTDGISADAGFALHFKLGLTKADGFFVNTHDGWGPDNKARAELQVGLAFDLPDTMVAELAFIKINVDKATGDGHDATKPLFAGAFQIDLKAPGEASCFKGDEAACTPDENAKIKFADLGNAGNLFGVSLTGAFTLDWIVEAQVDSAFPGVRANFQLKWSFDNQAPQAAGAPYIAFKDVGISAGSFFENLLGDVVKKMKQVTGPLQPVMDTLYAPIPVLSDLSRMAGGGDVTLMTLAKSFSTLAGGPKLDFVDTIKSVIEFINRLPTCSPDADNDCYVPLGDFEIAGDKALDTSNSPTTADKMYKSVNAKSGTEVKSNLNSKNENPTAADNPIFGGTGLAPAKGDAESPAPPSRSWSSRPGVQPADGWRRHAGRVRLRAAHARVQLATGLRPGLRAAAGVRDAGGIGVGQPADRRRPGHLRHPQGGRGGAERRSGRRRRRAGRAVLQDRRRCGQPDPGRPATGEIAAGAAVSAVIITVGIEGGLRLTIGFSWNDPNKDGKFRVSEFLHAALNNPLCLFTVSGRLSLFLRVSTSPSASISSR